MTNEEALLIVKYYRGVIRADHKLPEWDDFTERDCVFHVELWRPSCRYAAGVFAGGNTLVEAVSIAYKELVRREKLEGKPELWREMPQDHPRV